MGQHVQFLLFAFLVQNRSFGAAVNSSAPRGDPFSSLSIPVMNLLREVLAELQTEEVSFPCRSDTAILVKEAIASKPWALKIMDSMGKPSSGIMGGGLAFPGFYSECMALSSGEQPNHYGSNSKYCFSSFQLASGGSASSPRGHGDVMWSLYPNVRIGLCVPSACSNDDVQKAIVAAAASLAPGATARVLECYSGEKNFTNDIGAWIVLSVISVFILLASVGTMYDVSRPFLAACRKAPSNEKPVQQSAPTSSSNPSISDSVVISNASSETLYKSKKSSGAAQLGAILCSFSLLANSRRILSTAPTEGSMDSLHGIRFLSMAWIMIGHSFSFAQQWLFFRNPNSMASAPKDFLSQAFANGTFAVDTFFFLSGFLVAYTVFKEMKKNEGRLNLPLFYLHRYLRLTPLMMIVIAFCSTLLQYLGQGPAWTDATLMYDAWCKNNWWLNALYLQNFIDREHMCLSHTWYSAVDMQLYAVSPLILFLCYRHVYLALAALVIPFVVTSALPIYFTLTQHLPAVPSPTIPGPLMNDYYGAIYIKPYCRMGPYLVGIALAYFQFKNKSSFNLSKKLQILGWSSSLIINLAVIYSMGRVFNSDLPTDLEAAFYNGFARTAWATSIAWLVFACSTGHGGFLNGLLSIRAFVPLSRLTYTAYLIHPVLMALFYGSRETIFDYSLYWLIYMVLGNIVITYIASFILSLLFESPVTAIEKFLRGKC